MDFYQKDLSRVEILEQEEAALLATEMKNGSIEARNKLVESCLRYVCKIACGYAKPTIPREDLIQEAGLKTMQAVQRWEPEQGHILPLVERYVRNGLVEHLNHSHKGVYLPLRTKKQVKLFCQGGMESVEGNLKHSLSVNRHSQILAAVEYSSVKEFSVMKSEEKDFDAFDIPEPASDPAKEHCIADVESLLEQYASPEERQIIRMQYGLGCKQETNKEIGRQLGMDRFQVKRIGESVILRLKCKTGRCPEKPKLKPEKHVKKAKTIRVQPCEFCGEIFKPMNNTAKFCSRSCHTDYQRQNSPNNIRNQNEKLQESIGVL